IAELAGESELTFAIDHGGFRTEDRTADFGPREASDEADFALFVREAVAELEHAQEVVNVIGSDGDRIVRAFFDYLARDLATDVAYFAFKIADASFTGVVADQSCDCIVGELNILFVQPRLFHLLFDQELLGDLDLLRFGVAVEA